MSDEASSVPVDGYIEVRPLFQRLAKLAPDDPERAVARDELVTRCLPLAEHIARRFGGRGESREDLLQVARLGLVNAVDRFDVDRETEFISFAVPTIMGEIRRYFRDSGWAVRVPRRLKELHLAISKATGVLAQRLGRAPTPTELAAELKIDIDELSDGLVAGNAYHTISVESTISDKTEDLSLLDTVGDYDGELEKVDNHETLKPLLDQLPERERTIVMLRFFGNMTQTQIAEQIGVSQMHVSRLLSRTLEYLREKLSE
ncbi:MAG: polymerase sigma-B factor [Actinomycetota bacterium]|nr:polymerase sigma-B factor [Actinomycetota bacterium]